MGTAGKVSRYGVISAPYFHVFGLNTEIYGVNLGIQFEYRKIRTRNNSVFGHFHAVGDKQVRENPYSDIFQAMLCSLIQRLI